MRKIAEYKGRRYLVLWAGMTKFGDRVKLQGTRDVFWVDRGACRILEESRGGELSGFEAAPRPVAVTVRTYGDPTSDLARKVAAVGVEAMRSFGQDLAARGGAMAGEFPEWDDAAWKRLEKSLGGCHCGEPGVDEEDCPLGPYMLMFHESEGRAAFKHSETRRYIYA